MQFIFRYVTHEDIQEAKLRRRRRRKTAPSKAETLCSSTNKSNDSLCNASEVETPTSQDRNPNEAALKRAVAAFGINTRLLYDPLELRCNNGSGSICSYERFRVGWIKTTNIK